MTCDEFRKTGETTGLFASSQAARMKMHGHWSSCEACRKYVKSKIAAEPKLDAKQMAAVDALAIVDVAIDLSAPQDN